MEVPDNGGLIPFVRFFAMKAMAPMYGPATVVIFCNDRAVLMWVSYRRRNAVLPKLPRPLPPPHTARRFPFVGRQNQIGHGAAALRPASPVLMFPKTEC